MKSVTIKLEFAAEPQEDGRRLRDFLRSRGVSHSLLVEAAKYPDDAARAAGIPSGAVLVNGDAKFMSERVRAGDVVTFFAPDCESTDNIAPTPMELRVLYEDEFLLAVDKPAGIAVHPSRAHVYDTLANGVMARMGADFRFRAVTRLDLGTSGVTLISKHSAASCWLSQPERADMVKTYVGVAEGVWPESLARIDAPIARETEGEQRRVVRQDGERAVTLCRPLRVIGGENGGRGARTLVEFRLLTGRTHQIRVHCAYSGHPLVGDRLYNPGESPEIGRQALHARSLELTKPFSDERIAITAPVPEDILSII